MNLTPREKDKLLVSMAAMVARRRLDRGVKLNHPEAIALITDFVVEGARDGRSVADLETRRDACSCAAQGASRGSWRTANNMSDGTRVPSSLTRGRTLGYDSARISRGPVQCQRGLVWAHDTAPPCSPAGHR